MNDPNAIWNDTVRATQHNLLSFFYQTFCLGWYGIFARFIWMAYTPSKDTQVLYPVVIQDMPCAGLGGEDRKTPQVKNKTIIAWYGWLYCHQM